jgi:2-polyprenyl-3-methyl-5-hydroxy-6-metoxy-1,4-benzoquinol methylase
MKVEFKRIADIKRLNFITAVLKEKLPAGAEVLDVGCGNGVISRSLGELGLNVKGVDVSEKTIEKARSLNNFPNVTFEVVSAEQLVAEGHRYHAVVCSEVLEHLQNPGKLLKVLHKLLYDDGVLIVTVPNGKGPRELFVTRPVQALQKKKGWTGRMIKKMKKVLGYAGTTVQSEAEDLKHLQFFTKTALEELADENDFRIVQFGKTNFIEDVFPFSFFAKRIKTLQKWDCALAEHLPYRFTGGFVTVWEKASPEGKKTVSSGVSLFQEFQEK